MGSSSLVQKMLSSDSQTRVEDKMEAYKNGRFIMGIAGLNLIVQGGMAAYYQFLRQDSVEWNPETSTSKEILGIVSFSIAIQIVCGISGLIGALTSCTTSARACLFGWIWTAGFQIGETIVSILYANKAQDHDQLSHLEHLIIAETIFLVLLEIVFILCIAEFITSCQWYNEYVAVGTTDGYTPLLDNADVLDLENNNTRQNTYFQNNSPSISGRPVQYTSA